jgi:hypothetical protein
VDALSTEEKIIEALSRSDIGSLPRDVQFDVAGRIISSLQAEGYVASYRLRIAGNPGSPRTLTVAWSANLPCPTRELSVTVADLTTEHWELASVMES